VKGVKTLFRDQKIYKESEGKGVLVSRLLYDGKKHRSWRGKREKNILSLEKHPANVGGKEVSYKADRKLSMTGGLWLF